jgi:hypothetical protein
VLPPYFFREYFFLLSSPAKTTARRDCHVQGGSKHTGAAQYVDTAANAAAGITEATSAPETPPPFFAAEIEMWN